MIRFFLRFNQIPWNYLIKFYAKNQSKMLESRNYANGIKILIDSVLFGGTFYLLTTIIYVTASEKYSLEKRLMGRRGEPSQRVRGSGLSLLRGKNKCNCLTKVKILKWLFDRKIPIKFKPNEQFVQVATDKYNNGETTTRWEDKIDLLKL